MKSIVLLRVSFIFEVEKMKISEKQFAFAQTLEILEMFLGKKAAVLFHISLH